MKRIPTLVGSIIGIAYSAICTTLTIVFFGVLLAFLNGVNALVLVIGIVATALAIVPLVLNAIALRCFACSVAQYAKRRKLLIAAAVFDIAPSSTLILVVLVGLAEIFLLLPAMLLGLVAGILIIVDIRLEKGRVDSLPSNAPTEQTTQTPLPPEQEQ